MIALRNLVDTLKQSFRLILDMLKNHIISLLIASTLSLVLVIKFIDWNKKPYKLDDFTFAANYSNKDHIHTMQEYLNRGRIIIFGSSELNRDQRFVPQKFFNSELNIPLVTFGHGYHQTFSIMSQLAAFYNTEMEKNARIGILISPLWFRSGGTVTQSFLEFMPEEMLRKLYFNDQIDDRYKLMIGKYIREHKNEIVGSSSMITHASEYGQSLFAISNWFRTQYNKLKFGDYYNGSYSVDLLNNADEESEDIVTPDWVQLMSVGLKLEEAKMTSNSFGIEDNYWEYLLDHTSGGTELMSMGDLPALEANKEYEQLIQLLDFCMLLDIKPLFIMQAQNPLIYHDIERYDNILNNVELQIESRGFTYYNMHTSDRDKYIKGTLTDTAHMGEYGWVKMNKVVYEYFLEEK